MKNELHQQIIEDYIKAYNNFEIDRMLSSMHDDVVFENISNGDVTIRTNGLAELKQQAEQAKQFFRERKETITDITFLNDKVEIEIDYKATLAVDFSEELKAGDTLRLKGKSVFEFRNGKISKLTDIS